MPAPSLCNRSYLCRLCNSCAAEDICATPATPCEIFVGRAHEARDRGARADPRARGKLRLRPRGDDPAELIEKPALLQRIAMTLTLMHATGTRLAATMPSNTAPNQDS